MINGSLVACPLPVVGARDVTRVGNGLGPGLVWSGCLDGSREKKKNNKKTVKSDGEFTRM